MYIDGWELCLVVMGGASSSKGCEFKSQRLILDGSFFKFNYYKNRIDV